MKRDRVPADVAERVIRRDRGCVAHRWGFALDRPCRGHDVLHHRKLRSQGGPHTEANLIVLCDWHHRYAHDQERALANAAGIIVSGHGPTPTD